MEQVNQVVPRRDEGLAPLDMQQEAVENGLNGREVEVLPTTTAAEHEIGTAFGIADSEYIEASPLKEGQDLLNKDFSRLDLSVTAAKTNTTYNGFAKTLLVGLKTIWNFVVNGAQLVSEAKANQELLKNPVIATEAIGYLAALRAKGVTVDLTRYRDHKLEQEKNEEGEVIKGPKGTELDVGIANAKEEAHLEAALSMEARLPEKYRSKLEGSADIFATRQVAITDLQDAMNAISALAPSFDAQRQMVAAVTHNIAMQAGIIDEHGTVTDQPGMNFLVDQMSSLWI